MESDEIKKNLQSQSVWMRGLYMFFFLIAYGIAEGLIFAIVLFQFAFNLITSASNERLIDLGRQLSEYVYKIMLYLTFVSEDKPFPFSDWESK